ncbi:MAG: hypothetical protein KDA37_13270, partial [Planctomycetales bacterium]|nr:hypothetical protein [Planctomycetales bacterium]
MHSRRKEPEHNRKLVRRGNHMLVRSTNHNRCHIHKLARSKALHSSSWHIRCRSNPCHNHKLARSM